MVMAGALLSIVFPLMQDDKLGAAYVCLMSMISAFALPLVDKIGALNNLESLAFIVVIIVTEVFYGSILNFRNVYEVHHIWMQVVAPNISPVFVHIAIGWGIYMIPPWHSATYQMLQLSSQVTSEVAGYLMEASRIINSGSENEETPEAEGNERIKKEALQALANALLEQTNYSGLATPLALYGDMGLYKTSVLYPHLSLRADSFHRLGKYLDETAFLIALQMWALGEIVDDIQDQELLRGTATQLEVAAKLARGIASVLSCPRKRILGK
jgi:hypothetical protein